MTFKKLATLAMATVVSASLLVGCSGSKESAHYYVRVLLHRDYALIPRHTYRDEWSKTDFHKSYQSIKSLTVSAI